MVNKEKLNLSKGKLLKLNIEDLIKAHPLIKGVLSSFDEYVETVEPQKSKRPKLRVNITDLVDLGFKGVLKTAGETSETCRMITLTLSAVKDGVCKNLIIQPAKTNNMLGIFYEGDTEGERAVALFVEGLISKVITQLAVVGGITATQNCFYSND